MKLPFIYALLSLALLQGCASSKAGGSSADGSSAGGSVAGRPSKAVGKVHLHKSTFRPGEQIDLHIESPGLHPSAWVGVVPADVEHGSEAINDQNDLNHCMVTTSPLFLVAPPKPGLYEVRLNDLDLQGRELDAVPFEVAGEPYSGTDITLEKRVVGQGEPVVFEFTVPASCLSDAWIGIVPAGIPHGIEPLNDKHEHGYVFLAGRRKGKAMLPAPSYLGSYDLRLHESDAGGDEIGTSLTFEVIELPGPTTSPTP